MTGGTLSLHTLSDAIWQQQSVRSAFKLATFVLGIVLVLEVFVRAYLVFALNIETSLIVLPVLFQSLQIITLLWCAFFLRKAVRKGQYSVQRVATVPLVEEKCYR